MTRNLCILIAAAFFACFGTLNVPHPSTTSTSASSGFMSAVSFPSPPPFIS